MVIETIKASADTINSDKIVMMNELKATSAISETVSESAGEIAASAKEMSASTEEVSAATISLEQMTNGMR